MVEFGVGLAIRWLERAFEVGVRSFDTAPSYGVSEERMGRAAGVSVAVNRPFGMRKVLYQEGALTKTQAFRCILERRFRGVIFERPKSVEHLEENWRCFQEATRPSKKGTDLDRPQF